MTDDTHAKLADELRGLLDRLGDYVVGDHEAVFRKLQGGSLVADLFDLADRVEALGREAE